MAKTRTGKTRKSIESNQSINQLTEVNMTKSTNFPIINTDSKNGKTDQLGLHFYEHEGSGIVWSVRVVVDTNAPWVYLGGYDPRQPQERNNYNALCAREAISAGMELLEEFFDVAPGLHIRPEGVGVRGSAGYVASWNTNPKYAQFMPLNGWNEIGYMKVGNNLVYELLGPARQEAFLKHSYLDMLIMKSANFDITVPKYLQEAKQNVAGEWSLSWIETIRRNALGGKEAARNGRLSGIQKKVGNNNLYNAVRNIMDNGETVKTDVLVVKTKDGEELKVADIPSPSIIHVWLSPTSEVRLRTFEWDGTSEVAAQFEAVARNNYAVTVSQ